MTDSPTSPKTASADPTMTRDEIFHWGLFCALASALFEVVFRSHLPVQFGSLTRHPTYLIVTAPLSTCFTYVIWSALVLLCVSVIKPLRQPRAALGLVFLPFFATITFSLMPWIASYASVILALGLGATTARLYCVLLPRLRWLPILRPIASAAMILGFVIGALVVAGRVDIGPPTATAAKGAPNVLFITLDTLRAANMSLYGYERETTPNLARLAEKATVFERASSTTSWTLPSHSSMFTGLWAHQTRSDWARALPDDRHTLAEIFRERGYDTAGFIANLAYCTARSGLAQGFAHYEDHGWNPRGILHCTEMGRWLDSLVYLLRGLDPEPYPGRKNAARITGDFQLWLNSRAADRPFFVFLNYFDVHQPYLNKEPWRSKFDHQAPGEDERAVVRLAAKSQQDYLRDIDLYDGSLAYLDRELGKLFADLELHGLLESTLVVITSDHGETFGEHPANGHGNSLYDEQLHVPLMISKPGLVPEGGRVSREVSLRDLGRTVLHLAGADDAAGEFPGEILPFDNDEQVATSPIFCQLSQGIRFFGAESNKDGAVLSILRDDLHLIIHRDPRRGDELYDLKTDPFERDNLIKDEAYATRLAALRAELTAVSETAR